MKRKLDEKGGMKNLQIGRGWLDQICPAPVFERLNRWQRQFDFHHGENWQVNMYNRFVMIERKLFTFAP